MYKKISKFITLMLLGLVLSYSPVETSAQCPMCKMSAEQNLKDGGTTGKGLNKGILYMFSAPYLIVGTVAFLWFRNRKPEDEVEEV